jgi:uncharacterized membrane protein HdeD (DUF308 family)
MARLLEVAPAAFACGAPFRWTTLAPMHADPHPIERALPGARTSLSGWQWVVVAGSWAALPLALVLNALRPDLIAPMLESPFGQSAVLLTFGLCFSATAVSGGCFALANRRRGRNGSGRGLNVIGVVAAVVLFALPACFVVMFAPIVFVLMYGEAAP